MSTIPELLLFGIIADGLDIFWCLARAAYHYHLSTTANTTLFNYYHFYPSNIFYSHPTACCTEDEILGSTGGILARILRHITHIHTVLTIQRG